MECILEKFIQVFMVLSASSIKLYLNGWKINRVCHKPEKIDCEFRFNSC